MPNWQRCCTTSTTHHPYLDNRHMKNRNLLGKHRVRIAQVIFWTLFVYTFVISPIEIAPLEEAKGLLGSLIAALGVLIRSLSAGYISKNTYLASRGLYALTRNPLYFGSFVALLGINIIIWDPLFAAVSLLLYAITYIPTIRGEEKSLAGQFGDNWQTFKKNTPRFFPAFWRLHAYREIEWSFEQWKHNREYNAVIALIIIIGLLAWYAN